MDLRWQFIYEIQQKRYGIIGRKIGWPLHKVIIFRV